MTIRNQRFSLLKQPIFSILNQHLINYPTPSNLNYWAGFGPLAGICLVIQIVTGIFLAMHYTPHVDLAFNNVEHIMRDVEGGWFLRYMHANGASMFLIVVHFHMFRSLYYGSYSSPREFVRCSAENEGEVSKDTQQTPPEKQTAKKPDPSEQEAKTKKIDGSFWARSCQRGWAKRN